MRRDIFRVEYRYRRPSSSSWCWTTRRGDVSSWSGRPPGRSETAVADWLKHYHGGADIIINDLEWEGDDNE